MNKEKEELLVTAALDWLMENPLAAPQFSTHTNSGSVFNDNSDADSIERAITDAGESAGYRVYPDEVVSAFFAAKDRL